MRSRSNSRSSPSNTSNSSSSFVGTRKERTLSFGKRDHSQDNNQHGTKTSRLESSYNMNSHGGSSSSSSSAFGELRKAVVNKVSNAKSIAGPESDWRAYKDSEEYYRFRLVIHALRQLPPVSKIAEARAEFEFFLHALNRLGDSLNVEKIPKVYRSAYSPEVQLTGYLYSTLLTAFTLLPSYVLNDAHFYVSDTVLDQCHSLAFVFQQTLVQLENSFESLQPYSFVQIRGDVKRTLVYFDRSWCRFEIPALEEIEVIHRQACRPLIDAIQVNAALLRHGNNGGGADAQSKFVLPYSGNSAASNLQNTMPSLQGKGSKLEGLMESVNELNQLANVEGKGRNDMTAGPILEAERLIRDEEKKSSLINSSSTGNLPRLFNNTPGRNYDNNHGDHPDKNLLNSTRRGRSTSSVSKSPVKNRYSSSKSPVKMKGGTVCLGGNACSSSSNNPVLERVARNLVAQFTRLKKLLMRYSKCLYQVNSHLANNPDLVVCLEKFESAWELGSKFLVGNRKRVVGLLFKILHAERHKFDPEDLDPELLFCLSNWVLFHEMRGFLKNQKATAKKSSYHVNTSTAKNKGAFESSTIAKEFLSTGEKYEETVAALQNLSDREVEQLGRMLSEGSNVVPDDFWEGEKMNKEGAWSNSRKSTRVDSNSKKQVITPCPPRIMPMLNKEQGGDISTKIDVGDEDLDVDVDVSISINRTNPLKKKNNKHVVMVPDLSKIYNEIVSLGTALQRNKPEMWNECIQVVLEGMLWQKKREANR